MAGSGDPQCGQSMRTSGSSSVALRSTCSSAAGDPLCGRGTLSSGASSLVERSTMLRVPGFGDPQCGQSMRAPGSSSSALRSKSTSGAGGPMSGHGLGSLSSSSLALKSTSRRSAGSKPETRSSALRGKVRQRIWVWTILLLIVMLVICWMVILVPFLSDGDLLLLIDRMLRLRGPDTVRISKVKGHADEARFFMVRYERLTGWVIMLLMMLLTLVDVELVMLSLMLVVICLGSVVAGSLLFLIFIDFSLPFLELWLLMIVLLLILWYGLLVLIPRGVVWFMRFRTGLFCLGHLAFGIRNGFMFLYLLSALRTLLFGPIPLVFWLSGSPFLGSLHWPTGGLDLGVDGVSFVELLILYELLGW